MSAALDPGSASTTSTLAAVARAGAQALILVLGLTTRASASDATAAAALAERYQHQVKPLLATYCVGCHDLEKHKGDLDLGVYAADAEALRARRLWKAVAAKVADGDMPPEDEKKQPTADERQVIRQWVASLKNLDHPDAG